MSSTSESKRSHSQVATSPRESASSKRRRDDDTNFFEPFTTVSDSLGVPLDIIFRQVPQAESNKPLLSRSEAQTFLTVRLLAQELDSLTALSGEALRQQNMFGSMMHRITATDNPYLRPLLSILHFASRDIPDRALSCVQQQLERLISDLSVASKSLRQFSEQNWNLYESLGGTPLAEEKKRLSDIQDETCNRIDSWIAVAERNVDKDNDSSEPVLTMKEYCKQKFNLGDDLIEARAESNSQSPPTKEPENKLSSPAIKETEARVEGDMSVSSLDQQTPQKVDLGDDAIEDRAEINSQSPPTKEPENKLSSPAIKETEARVEGDMSVSSLDQQTPQKVDLGDDLVEARAESNSQSPPTKEPENKLSSPAIKETEARVEGDLLVSSLDQQTPQKVEHQNESATNSPSIEADAPPFSPATGTFSPHPKFSSSQSDARTTSQLSPPPTAKSPSPDALQQEKENMSSQEKTATPFDGARESQAGSSQASFGDSQRQLGSATQAAAEVLSAMAASTTEATPPTL